VLRDTPTSREREIVLLSGGRLTNREIATALGLKASTVKWYWERIFLKLGARSRGDAIVAARHAGWLESHDA
jgi:DNA-binding CsgD family transcriptional regulator